MNCLPTDFLIVVGAPGPLDLDLEQLGRRMAVPAVRQDLEPLGLADPCALLYTSLAEGDEVGRYLGDGPLNTDDRPVLLSYSTYDTSFRSTIAGNLVQLLACRGDVGRLVRHGPDRTTQLRQQVASNEALLGHVALWGGDPRGALAHYAAEAQVLPGDPALQRLVVGAYLQVAAASRYLVVSKLARSASEGFFVCLVLKPRLTRGFRGSAGARPSPSARYARLPTGFRPGQVHPSAVPFSTGCAGCPVNRERAGADSECSP